MKLKTVMIQLIKCNFSILPNAYDGLGFDTENMFNHYFENLLKQLEPKFSSSIFFIYILYSFVNYLEKKFWIFIFKGID